MKILVLNAGSSSQKSCLYNLPDDVLPNHSPNPLWEATIDWTAATDYGLLKVQANGTKQMLQLDAKAKQEGIARLLATLVEGETQVLNHLAEVDVVGHRVVHGGSEYSQPTRITPAVKATIARLISLAPNHNPAHLEGIEAIEQVLGNVPQVAVFDTAFHSHIPKPATVYPIPYEWFEQGIRRYGFHGISHQYCAERAAQLLGKPLVSLRLITCHLGNGCSLAAVADGRSIDTTMGFTPLEGLMMGSRSGSIDPAILIYWLREKGMNADQLDALLNKASGLKGVAGESGDMRSVLAGLEQGDDRAMLAFEMYVHHLKRWIGAMLASLGGLDALVFTAGVGENVPQVRQRVCEGFAFLGLGLDLGKNNDRPIDSDIATPSSRVRVLVIHTEEDWAIARASWQITSGLYDHPAL